MAGLGTGSTLAATVDVSGYVTSPNDVIGADNTANMTDDTTFGWQTHACAIPVVNNGFLFSMDSGGGNYYNYTGDISGTGGLYIGAGGIDTLHIGGGVGNTYTGPTVVNNGPVSLEKTSGNALCGAITVQGSGGLLWTASDQISDTSDVTLTSTAALDLDGFSDTINELHMVSGSFVQTGTGGVLKVARLFLDDVQQPETAHGAGDGFVSGSGYIEVGASGPPVITDPPSAPANPVPADSSANVSPAALHSLNWDDCPGASGYDVYLWLASDQDPVPGTDAPTANVSFSGYVLPSDLLSLTGYKWRVVAKNAIGDTTGPVWTFATLDRRDISTILTPGPQGPPQGILIDETVGIGNTGRLVGSTQTYWGSGGFSVNLNLNGNTLIVDSGGGNTMNAAGAIFGNGVLLLQDGGANPIRVQGGTGNTYTGTTFVTGNVSLEKTGGNALSGTITVNDSSSLVWAGGDQISDASRVTLAAGSFLNLDGFTDTIARLALETGASVQTGAGGVLTTLILTVDGAPMASGTYTSTNSAFVTGTGSVVVSSSGIATTTALASSCTPSSVGAAVTFTATITAASGSASPTGSVQFMADGTELGAPVTVTGGTGPHGIAAISVSTLTAEGSPHVISAGFFATGGFQDSTGILRDGQSVGNSYADWIASFDFSAFTNPDLSPTGDPDGDGLSNIVEYAYGLDPSQHDDFANGLTRERWQDTPGSTVADLTTNRARFLDEPDERVLVPGVNEIAQGDDYGSRYRGFITAPVTGTYYFWIAARDEAELWLADGSIKKSINGQTVGLTNRFGKQRIAFIRDDRTGYNYTEIQEFDKFPSQHSRPIQFQAGQRYYFEVLHKQGNGPGHIEVAWQTPGSTRQIIPAEAFNGDFTEAADMDSDGLPDLWEEANFLNPTDNGIRDPRDGERGDADGDGLTNLEEYQLDTNPNSRDTDGDGLSDKEERDFYHTNPLVSNMITAATYATLPPQNYATATGHWNRDTSGSLTALERRGEITYNFTVAAGDAGVFEIVLTGGAAGVPRPVENLPLVFSINGDRIGSATLTCCGPT